MRAARMTVLPKKSSPLGSHYYEGDIASLNLGEQFDYGVFGFVTQMFDDLTTVQRRRGRDSPSVPVIVTSSGVFRL